MAYKVKESIVVNKEYEKSAWMLCGGVILGVVFQNIGEPMWANAIYFFVGLYFLLLCKEWFESVSTKYKKKEK